MELNVLLRPILDGDLLKSFPIVSYGLRYSELCWLMLMPLYREAYFAALSFLELALSSVSYILAFEIGRLPRLLSLLS